MAVSALFLIGYGCLRFGSEFLREPDRHLSYIAFDWLTMGQLLSSPMIIIGLVFLYVSYRRSKGKS
jgi:phosphatidylglycerol:prolipoprotein diacylglycerol transferase